MKRHISLLLLFVFIQLISFGQDEKTPAKKINRFFGIHVDFHANASSNEVGKTLTEGMVDSMLTFVKPDFLQVDCKGHPGYSSYATKVGTPAPRIINDPLRIFRNVTFKHHIPLYVHYSGVLDARAIELHPDWANINEKGEADKNTTSPFSAYVDELMIPQLKELITRYKIDGAWVDGDCWAVQPDYSPAAIALFQKETSIATVPHNRNDSGYYAFMDFNRRHFRTYVGHYVDAVHQFDPSFLITSNWSYSSMMPEAVDTHVDFLSGDMATRDYVANAAFEARCLAEQGKPWDLMAWAFTFNWENNVSSYKSAVQLEQEAANVLAMGGGFQMYYPQNSDASIKPWKIKTMAEVAKFCRARQAYTYGATSIPQIAMLHSTEGFKHKVNGLYNNFSGLFDEEEGVLNALLDGQHCVDILMEHSLENKMQDYKLIVIAGWDYLSPAFIAKLRDYVNEGGSLLLIGAKISQLFQPELGVNFEKYEEKKMLNLGYKDDMATVLSNYQKISLQAETKAFGSFYSEQDLRFPDGIPASIRNMSKGKIAAVYVDLGNDYLKRQAPVMRSFLSGLVDELFPDPMVMVEGSHLVTVTLNKLGDNYAVNLINTGGAHANKEVYAYDEVLPIGPLKVALQLAKKPQTVTLQPGNAPLTYSYANGRLNVVVPTVALHSILVIKP